MANQSTQTPLLVLRDGSFLQAAAGSDSQSHPTIGLEHSTKSGTPDPTFGTQGVGTFAVPAGMSNVAVDLIVTQADGKTVVGGQATAAGGGEFLLVRFNSDGSVDNSFGQGGYATTPVGATLQALTVEPDGKIVAAGLDHGGQPLGAFNAVVARFQANGSVDTNFGTGGAFSYPVDPAYPFRNVIGLAVTPDGHIDVGYTSADANHFDGSLGVARLSTSGALDTSFNQTGFSTISLHGSQSPQGPMALQTDGRIVIGDSGVLARFNTDGSVDSTFGNGGMVSGFGVVDAILSQPDGRLLIARKAPDSSGQGVVGLSRLNADGSIDVSFGGGTVLSSYTINSYSGVDTSLARLDSNFYTTLSSVTATSDGSILVGSSVGVTRFADRADSQVANVHLVGAVNNDRSAGGTLFTLAGTVASADAASKGPPTGSVWLVRYGSGIVSKLRVQADGSVQFSIPNDGRFSDLGTHHYAIFYEGDGNYAPSNSGGIPVTILPPPPPVVVVHPTSLTFTGSVSPTDGTVTLELTLTGSTNTFLNQEIINISEGPKTLANAALDQGRVYDPTTDSFRYAATIYGRPQLSPGTHTLTASFAGNDQSAPSTAQITLTVPASQVSTTTTLTTDNTTATAGDSVTLTATVLANVGNGPPTGSVQFLSGTTLLGTVSLDGTGTATLATTALPVGDDNITAVYSGDSADQTSTSTPLRVGVGQASTTTTLTADQTSITAGQGVTLTATVAGATPTGSVQFLSGTTLLGTANLDGTSTATLATSALLVGNDSITAVYSGDNANQVSTSSPLTIAVALDSTTTTLGVDTQPATAGQNVTFTATVAAGDGIGTPTGSVQFLNGSTLLGTVNLDGTGTATYSTSALPPGDDAISVVYSGDAAFAVSNASLTETVVLATPTLDVEDAGGLYTGSPFAATATVNGAASLEGVTPTLSYYAGTFANVVDLIGQTSLAAAPSRPGDYTAVATFAGSADYAAASALADFTISPATATVDVEDASGAYTGAAFAATATVNGAASLEGVALTLSYYAGTFANAGDLTGQPALTAAPSRPGSYTAVATFVGSADYGPGSALADFTISHATTVTSLATAQPTISYGQSTTLTATVVNTDSQASPTGHVEFFDGTKDLGAGTLASSAGPTSTWTLTPALLQAGTHTIQANYSDPAGYFVSSGDSLAQTVNKVAPTLGGLISSTILTTGTSVTVNGQLATGTAPPPAGEFVAITLNGTTRQATIDIYGRFTTAFSTTALTAGSYTVGYAYAGDNNFKTATGTGTLKVNAVTPQFSALTTANVVYGTNSVRVSGHLTASSGAVPAGEKVSVTLNGVTQSATLATDGSFSTNFATASLAAGSYPVIFRYAGDVRFNAATAGSSLVIHKAAASISGLVSKSVVYGTNTVAVSGHLTASSGVVPTGEKVSVTLNGVTQSATLDSHGNFTTSFATAALAPRGYTVSYAYLGDANFNGVTSNSSLTVTKATPAFSGLKAVKVAFGAATATFTGQVVGPAATNPPETVTVSINGGPMATGKLDSTGHFSVPLAVGRRLAKGSYIVVYSYGGDAFWNASSANGVLQVN